MLRGVLAIWPLMAASALCAAAISASIPHRLQATGHGASAADQVGVFRLEGQAPLFGGFKLGLAVVELLVEKRDRIGDIAAVARDVRFAEDIDQLLNHVFRQRGVLGIAQARLADRRSDREQIVLLALDHDVLGQALHRALHLIVGGDLFAQLGAAYHALEIDRADQRLADLGDRLLAVAGNLQLLGQDILELDIDPRPAFIAVGDERNRQPAEDAHGPGHRERKPAAVPHRMQRAAKFFDDFLHAPAVP
jgi:hypothetical protein